MQRGDLKDLSVSANVAYGQVKMESSAPDTYEELDVPVAGIMAPVYASAEETTSRQQPHPPEDKGHYIIL